MTPPDHIGKYEDLNLVGFGTYGSVYKAWDPDLDRNITIEVWIPRPINTPIRAKTDQVQVYILSYVVGWGHQ